MMIRHDEKMVVNGRLSQAGVSFTHYGSTGRVKRSAVFRCECGKSDIYIVSAVSCGKTKSCGCLIVDVLKKRNTTHGMNRTPTHNSWRGMVERCTIETHASYARYGGVGIEVCERWKVFEHFLEDMGERPDGSSIDRIDGCGNYEKTNCKWSTAKEQCRNQSRCRLLTIDGVTATIAEWCEHQTSVGYEAIRKRLRRGWSHKEAVFGKCNE